MKDIQVGDLVRYKECVGIVLAIHSPEEKFLGPAVRSYEIYWLKSNKDVTTYSGSKLSHWIGPNLKLFSKALK